MKKIVLPIATCQKCKESWNPRTPFPKKCPYCQSREWKKKN